MLRHDIDLWIAYYGDRAGSDFTDSTDSPRLLSLLNAQERQQQARFHFPDDRPRYLVTRAMVRTVLSRYADVAPENWVFESNAYGRPSISPMHTQAQSIRFNLSHTDGLIVLAVSTDCEIGVDVECLDRRANLDVADRFFSPKEAQELAALPPDEQAARFFDYWTLKESYIKARGMGLSIPLDSFSFSFPHGNGIRLTVDASQNDRAERWRFWQIPLRGNYLMAVCADQTSGADCAINLKQLRSLDAYDSLGVEVIRSSSPQAPANL